MFYWGTYEVDPAQGQVIHNILGAYVPEMVGTRQVRAFTIDGGQLVLRTLPAADGSFSEFVWRRAQPASP